MWHERIHKYLSAKIAQHANASGDEKKRKRNIYHKLKFNLMNARCEPYHFIFTTPSTEDAI